MGEASSGSSSSFMGWREEWSKKLTEGVAEVRKQVQQQVGESGGGGGHAGGSGGSVEALSKRVLLLEGVIKKLIPVKDNPTRLAELWNEGINAGKKLESLQEEQKNTEELIRIYDEQIQQLTLTLSKAEDELQRNKAQQNVKDDVRTTTSYDKTSEQAAHVLKLETLLEETRTDLHRRNLEVGQLRKSMAAQEKVIASLRQSLQIASEQGTSKVFRVRTVPETESAMVIVDVVTDIVNNVSAAVDGNTNGSMTPAERQTRGLDDHDNIVIEAMRKRNEELEFEIAALKEKLYIAEESALRAQEDLRRELEENTNAEFLRQQRHQDRERLKDAEDQARKDLDLVTSQLKEAHTKISALGKARQDAEESTRVALKGEQNAEKKERDIAEKNRNLTEQLRRLSEKLLEVERQSEDALGQRDRKLEELEAERGTTAAQLKKLQADDECSKDAFLAAEARYQSTLEELKTIRTLLKERTQGIEVLEANLAAEKLKIANLQNELASKEREFGRFKEKAKLAVGQRDTAITELRAEISVFRDRERSTVQNAAERKQYIDQLGKAQQELQSLKGELERLQSSNSSLEEAFMEARHQCDAMASIREKEQSSAKQEINRLEEQLRALDAAAKAAKQQGLEEGTAVVQAKTATLSNENELLQAKLRGLQKELKRRQLDKNGFNSSSEEHENTARSLHLVSQGPTSKTSESSGAPSVGTEAKSWQDEASELRALLEAITVENISLQKELSEARTKLKDAENVGGFLTF